MAKIIKKSVSVLLSLLMLLSVLQGCNVNNGESETTADNTTANETKTTDISDPVQNLNNGTDDTVKSFDKLNDPKLLGYMESTVYAEVLDHIDSTKYAVDNVEAVYISKEYLEESSYNSKSNVFFGYTLDELDEQFQGTKYVFTLGNDGKTTVKPFEKV